MMLNQHFPFLSYLVSGHLNMFKAFIDLPKNIYDFIMSLNFFFIHNLVALDKKDTC